MAELSDIQLRIIVQGSGLDNINRLNDGLNKAAGAVRASASEAVKAQSSWGAFREGLNALERQFDAVFRAASHLQALGRDLTGMGQFGLENLKASVDAWGEYEFSVHRAAGALGIFDTTSPIFTRLQNEIDKTAQSARLFPAEEVAKAVYYWGSATGQTVKSNKELGIVMEGLLPILQTAAITETDVEKAIKGTYQIIQQYNLGLTRLATTQDVAAGRAKRVGEEISNVRDVTEKLMMITQNTAVEYTDLIEAFRYTGTIAPALGVKYEDLLLVLGRLGDMGIRGSQAGRALQQMFTQLLDPTVRASKALDTAWLSTASLGKTFDEMVFPNGEFVGITELVDQLAAATENMTDKQRGELIGIITTQNEMRALVPLIEDQIRARREGINVYNEEKYNLDNASAQFEQTMHLLEISWKGTMGYLRESIGPVVRAIGQAAAAMAAPFVEGLGKMFISIKEFLDTHPDVTRWIVQFTAIASIALVVGGAIFTTLGVLLAFGAGIAFVVQGLSMAFLGFTQVINVVDDFGNVVGRRTEAVAGVLSRFVPIVTMIGLAVAGITAIWINNFGGIRDSLLRVADAFGYLFSKLDLGGTGSVFVDMFKSLGELILPLLERVARRVAGALDLLAQGIRTVADNPQAVDMIEKLITALAALYALNSASKFAGIAAAMLGIPGPVGKIVLAVGILYAAWDRNVLGIRDMTENAVKFINEHWDDVVDGIRSFANDATKMFDVVKQRVGKFVRDAQSLLSDLGEFIVDIGSKFFGPIVDYVASVLPRALEAGKRKFEQFMEPLRNMADDIVKFISRTIDQIVYFFDRMAEKISTALGEIAEYVLPTLGALTRFITDVLAPVLRTIIIGAINAVGIAVGILITAIVALVTAIQPLVDILVLGLTVALGVAMAALSSFVELVIGVVKGAFKIIEGIFDMFTGLLTLNWETFWNGLVAFLSGFVEILWGAIKAMFDNIFSLASGLVIIIGAALGVNIVKAVASGISSGYNLLMTALMNTIRSVALAAMLQVQLLGAAIGDAFMKAKAFAMAKAQPLITAFQTAWAFVETTAINIVKGIGARIAAAFMAAKALAIRVAAALIAAVTFVWVQVQAAVMPVVAAIGSAIGAAYNAAIILGQRASAAVVAAATGLWAIISAAVMPVVAIIGAAIGTAFDAAIALGIALGPAVIIAGLLLLLAAILPAIWDEVLEIGGNIIKGMVDGVGAAIGAATEAVVGFVGDIVGGILGFLGMESPTSGSKVMGDIGKSASRSMGGSFGDDKTLERAADEKESYLTVSGRRTGVSAANQIHSGYMQTIPGFTSAVQTTKNDFTLTAEQMANISLDYGLRIGNNLNTSIKQTSPEFTSILDGYINGTTTRMDIMSEIMAIKGRLSGDELAAALRSKDPQVRAAAEQYKATAEGRLTALQTVARTYGYNTGSSLADGLYSSVYLVDAASRRLSSSVGSYIGAMSPTKKGVLRHLMEFGPNIGMSLAQGLLSTVPANERAADAVAGAIASRINGPGAEGLSSDFGFEFDSNKVLTIRHEVSSPDGTVNGAAQDTLREIFTAEEFVSALEHMATVG
jgi:TP901 family phage tail tape measure protein